MNVEDFRVQYFNVFERHTGKILICSDVDRKQLISTCSKLYPGENFGDANTGDMNINAIRDAAVKSGILSKSARVNLVRHC